MRRRVVTYKRKGVYYRGKDQDWMQFVAFLRTADVSERMLVASVSASTQALLTASRFLLERRFKMKKTGNGQAYITRVE